MTPEKGMGWFGLDVLASWSIVPGGGLAVCMVQELKHDLNESKEVATYQIFVKPSPLYQVHYEISKCCDHTRE